MEKRELLYQGKVKKVFSTDDENFCVISYTDDVTAFNGLKKGVISGKGVINNRISNFLMELLQKEGVPTHFVKELSGRDTLVKRVDIIPIEFIVRNVAAGSLAKRLGLPEGTRLRRTILEYTYRNGGLGDPMVNTFHVLAMGLATEEELKITAGYALKINAILREYLKGANIDLIDLKLEFGKTADGEIILADEISPDTCRFWDLTTQEKLDKDRFRKELGNVEWAYNEVYGRLIKE